MGTEIIIALAALVVVALAAIAYSFLGNQGPKVKKPEAAGNEKQKSGHSKDKQKSVSPPQSRLHADQCVSLSISGGNTIRIEVEQFRIGRAAKDGPAPDLDLAPFTGKYGSRNHAEICIDRGSGHWKLRDLGSMNGTFVNERQLRPNEEHSLKHRDRISFTDRFEVNFEDPKSGERMPGISGYQVVELVAKGGMAGIYKCRAQNEELHAIKVPLDYGEDPKLSTLRLQDEFEILKRVRTPRSARAINFTQCADGRPAMIMEFLYGQTLRALLQISPVSPVDAVSIGSAIAEGIAALHNLDRIHCDLKPDNVMMRQKIASPAEIAQNVVIIDFGIAMQNRTTMKNVFGSANYQAPEHILGQQLTLKADVYSLGCMMYEMVANSRLYPEATEVRQIKEFQVNRMPMHVKEQAANQGRKVPDDLSNLIMLMLEKSPNVRPDLQSVSEQLGRIRSTMSTSSFERSH